MNSQPKQKSFEQTALLAAQRDSIQSDHSDHENRINVIRTKIEEKLKTSHGRMQPPSLFLALNTLPEYKVEQQKSGRKPLNYLLWQFDQRRKRER